MTSVDTTRFLRPHDLGGVPRNQRRIQFRRLLVLAANLLLIATLILAISWGVQQVHRDDRFAIASIEFDGAVHTEPSSLETVARQWEGSNLFELDIDLLRVQLTSLPWVAAVGIEKKVPDTVIVRIEERVPVALTRAADGGLRYVDSTGRVFADLSVEAGNADLPLIAAETDEGRARGVALLAALSKDHADLYDRTAEVTAMEPTGFGVWDRELAARLMVPEDGGADRWRRLHSLARVETWSRSGIEYADLRFARRIVVLPKTARTNAPARGVTAAVTSNVTSQENG